MKTHLAAIAAILSLCFLVSCTGIGGLSASLGMKREYSVEDITASVASGSEEWLQLYDMLHMLTVDSTEIEEFDSMKTSSESCRDSLLNYMYGRYYEKYAGNLDRIEEIIEKYPEYNIIAAIPQSDFEALMYKYFGGSVKITHKSSELFTYLKGGNVYIPVSAPIESGVDITLNSAYKTENTYRLSFTVSSDVSSSDYYAILVRREDSSCYFDSVYKATLQS